jgi:hypothetical protein
VPINPYQPIGDFPAAVPAPDAPVMVGTAAARPAAGPAHLEWYYFATDTNAGTLYLCTFTPGTGFAWTQVGGWVTAPAHATSTGTAGQMAYDSTYLYVCTAANTWKKIAWSGSDAW